MRKDNIASLLKEAQKKAHYTDPEIYRDRVLSATRQAMKETGKASIKIDHKRGEVRFDLDRDTDQIRMFLNGEMIPEAEMAGTLADLDGIGRSDTAADKAKEIIDASGITHNLGQRSVDAVLRAAGRQMRENSRTTGSVLKALLQILARTIPTR